MTDRRKVILDTNIFIKKPIDYDAVDPLHKDGIAEIMENLDTLLNTHKDANMNFVLIPSVAIELLFGGMGHDPDGMIDETYKQYVTQIHRCVFSTFTERPFSGDRRSHSHLFHFHHSQDLLDMHYILSQVRMDFKNEFGVDIYLDTSEATRSAIARRIGEEIPVILTDDFKLGMFHKVMKYLFLSVNAGINNYESVVRLGLSMFVFSCAFNVLKSESGKYPLSEYRRRHNLLCDFMIFRYGLVEPNCIILTADIALSRRGNLIYNYVNSAGVFIGLKPSGVK